MKNIDARSHVRGESLYVDDIPVREGTLHAAVFGSPLAHGKIKTLDVSGALASPGVVAVLTAGDIPGENQIGGIIPDEPLLAADEVHFMGMPVALVIAQTEAAARAAREKIKIEIDPLPVITDPREAARQGKLIIPPRTFALGETESAWKNCAHIFESQASNGGQEHLYIETQGAYAHLTENSGVRVVSSTQGPTAVQRTAARVLGVPMHQIEVDVTRLGGGFGGKEDQATAWGVMAALGAWKTRRPVKLILHRLDDMRMTGKRHPYSSDFKIGLDRDLKIIAYEATFYQNAGAAADLSPAVMERTLFHATNSYSIPNVRATAYSCRTNLPPNTAFRGFGGPQGMFVIESAIAKAAESLGVPAHEIQRRNLHRPGDEFPYGQTVKTNETVECFENAAREFDLKSLEREIARFNEQHETEKRGLALMPVCFGISFTKTHMNQARALVHVYHDGSVGVSTGAVEMGQGVNTKMLQVAAHEFGIAPERVRIETTNTTRVANTSPSAASATSDLNGKAVQQACRKIFARLLEVAATELNTESSLISIDNERVLLDGEPTMLDWKSLVLKAFFSRVNLSEHGHYATPDIHFDAKREKGEPFAYHTCGTAIVIATVDCVRGIYTIDRVLAVHDFGDCMNQPIDMGQIEGGIVQGLGWMTMEDLLYDKNGRLMSNALSTYKVPDIYSVPKEIRVIALETESTPHAIYKSKAVGEPPLMYGLGGYFAIRNAIRAFNGSADFPFDAPITPERTLMALYRANGNGVTNGHEHNETTKPLGRKESETISL